MQKSKKKLKVKSKLPGVTWNTASNSWVASLKIGGKAIFIGSFPDENYAGIAYNISLELLALLSNTNDFRMKVMSIMESMAKSNKDESE